MLGQKEAWLERSHQELPGWATGRSLLPPDWPAVPQPCWEWMRFAPDFLKQGWLLWEPWKLLSLSLLAGGQMFSWWSWRCGWPRVWPVFSDWLGWSGGVWPDLSEEEQQEVKAEGSVGGQGSQGRGLWSSCRWSPEGASAVGGAGSAGSPVCVADGLMVCCSTHTAGCSSPEVSSGRLSAGKHETPADSELG